MPILTRIAVTTDTRTSIPIYEGTNPRRASYEIAQAVRRFGGTMRPEHRRALAKDLRIVAEHCEAKARTEGSARSRHEANDFTVVIVSAPT